eukprot:CAMPEP_0202687988 /NCGR_PEP_ID=MMETSP1385-20130828/3530_1 /ASSEMBLY_ACC=CAM_ASM_000861 /TAXON_ID=933848 /ORGANISM="Elphidium margaritaceum" /LENGTH=120 /DNA_ID=CAMNT_0049342857 /DNA_START=121 /DNA_END=479 /DNA_ORIENTATION=+
MLVKKLVYISHIAALFSCIRTYAVDQTYTVTGSNVDVSCETGLDTCTIQCNDYFGFMGSTINCNDATNCVIECGAPYCLESTVVEAGSSTNLNISTSETECMRLSSINAGENVNIVVSGS